MTIRQMQPSEYVELENFLYEAIYIPDGQSKPPRNIIEHPELQVYVKDFGTRAADVCFVAEVDGQFIGACWSRIMNDYGHIDDETPSLALSVQQKNSAAVNLYRKLNFEVVDVRGEELLMRFNLGGDNFA